MLEYLVYLYVALIPSYLLLNAHICLGQQRTDHARWVGSAVEKKYCMEGKGENKERKEKLFLFHLRVRKWMEEVEERERKSYLQLSRTSFLRLKF